MLQKTGSTLFTICEVFFKWGEPHRESGGPEEADLAWGVQEEPQGRDTRSLQAPRSPASPRSLLPPAQQEEQPPPQLPRAEALVRQRRCPRIHQSSTGRCLGNLGIGR